MKKLMISSLICFLFVFGSCISTDGLTVSFDTVNHVVIDPEFPDNPKATVLFWTKVNRYNGIFVYNDWHGYGYLTPLVTLPAGRSTFDIDVRVFFPGYGGQYVRSQFTYNFQAGKEYFVTWHYEEKSIDPETGVKNYNYYLWIYEKLPVARTHSFAAASENTTGFSKSPEAAAMQPHLVTSILLFETNF
ncbi:MAG: hypothetical protein FWD47_00505 [Treponema sp.]|nr:hypothetical protein [Treponema sp.]